MWYTSGSGRIELNIPVHLIPIGYHSGQCAPDVAWIRANEPVVEDQLKKLNPEVLKNELREYGAWDHVELADHDANLSRILWLACGDLADQIECEQSAG